MNVTGSIPDVIGSFEDIEGLRPIVARMPPIEPSATPSVKIDHFGNYAFAEVNFGPDGVGDFKWTAKSQHLGFLPFLHATRVCLNGFDITSRQNAVKDAIESLAEMQRWGAIAGWSVQTHTVNGSAILDVRTQPGWGLQMFSANRVERHIVDSLKAGPETGAARKARALAAETAPVSLFETV